MIIAIDTETQTKSAMAYALAQASLALGKDDLRRARAAMMRALKLLNGYEELRLTNKEKKS